MSKLEEEFALQLRAHNIHHGWQREYKFHPDRRWRLDFVLPPAFIAVEIEGGTWSNQGKSRHTTATGFRGDCEKYNEAARLGWTVFRFDQKMVKSGEAINYLLGVLQEIDEEAL